MNYYLILFIKCNYALFYTFLYIYRLYPKFYPNQKFGTCYLYFLRKKYQNRRSFADFKGRLCRGGYLQGVMLAQYQRNVIVSFSLQSDTTLLSLEQCDISVAFFIFAKRYFPLSALDYRLLLKVA